MHLILASTSPYRKQLLEKLGLKFTVARPKVDEDALKNQGPEDLIQLTQFLAQKKAESLRDDFPKDIIIGGDQIAELNGERLDKPGNESAAQSQLKRMQGQAHRLITSIAVVSPLKTIVKTDITDLTMRKLRPDEIAVYLQIDRPFDCAGSYKIEKAGLTLMERVNTKDPSAIQGLPVISLINALGELGLDLNQLWSER